jgi:hypothetical protein
MAFLEPYTWIPKVYCKDCIRLDKGEKQMKEIKVILKSTKLVLRPNSMPHVNPTGCRQGNPG